MLPHELLGGGQVTDYYCKTLQRDEIDSILALLVFTVSGLTSR